MAVIKLKQAHDFNTLDEAKKSIRSLMDKIMPKLAQHIERIDWSEDGMTASISGRHVNGTFSIDEQQVLVRLRLSMLASLAKDKIENRIEHYLKEKL
jgi:putative polyhydroxyalkanoate system protein